MIEKSTTAENLPGYWEYHGADFAADAAKMAAHTKTKDWWALPDP